MCRTQVDETGVETKDVELVVQQASVSRAKVNISGYQIDLCTVSGIFNKAFLKIVLLGCKSFEKQQ